MFQIYLSIKALFNPRLFFYLYQVIQSIMTNIITKLPAVFVGILLFITTFLLSFLLVSCYDSAQAYSGIYLTSYTFNKDQMLVVSFNGNTTADDLIGFNIKVGYLYFCISYDDSSTCTSFSNIEKLDYYPIIHVDSGNDSTTIDLVKLAEKFNDICYSYILITVLILTLLSLLISIWNLIPLLPFKNMSQKIITALSLAGLLVWGLGAMLQHQATKVNKSLVPVASMNLVDVKVGSRADAVTWVAFSFLAVVSLGNGFLVFQQIKSNKNLPQIVGKSY